MVLLFYRLDNGLGCLRTRMGCLSTQTINAFLSRVSVAIFFIQCTYPRPY